MKKNIILTIFILCYITAFIVVNNYTTKINIKNKNNTYQISDTTSNYADTFLNSYINTILNERYENGFNMLDENTKKLFDNNLQKYSESIKYIKETIEHYLKDKTTTEIKLIEKDATNGNEVVRYEVVSRLWIYLEVSGLNYYKDYIWFKDLKLVEYLPKKYRISYTGIEKEGKIWEIKT